MKLLDVLTAPWAIVPEKLREIQAIYATHLKGEKIDLKAIEAKMGEPLDNNQGGYEVINGVAVFEMQGIVAKRMNMFTKISGGISTELFGRDFKEAMADSSVNSILIRIDSPGGNVDGTQELANLIYESRGQKPIIAVTDGMMASASYWIGSAADKVFISGDTTQVGSIGVVATHIDISRAEEMLGRKTTEITAGKYKRIASMYKPLSEDGKASIQDQVDYIYSVFVSDIARARGVTIEQALSGMADGRLFLGKQAISAGLVDGISTMDQLLNKLADGDSANLLFSVSSEHENKAPLLSCESKKGYKEVGNMNLEELKKKYPELYQSVIDEGKKTGFEEGEKKGIAVAGDSKLAEGIEQGITKGSEAEMKRIQDVEAQLIPGHETLIQTLKFDGKTTGPEAAVKVLAGEKKKIDDMAAAIAADGVKPAPVPAIDPTSEGQKSEAKQEQLIKEHQKEHKSSYKDAVLAVSREHPELFKREK